MDSHYSQQLDFKQWTLNKTHNSYCYHLPIFDKKIIWRKEQIRSSLLLTLFKQWKDFVKQIMDEIIMLPFPFFDKMLIGEQNR